MPHTVNLSSNMYIAAKLKCPSCRGTALGHFQGKEKLSETKQHNKTQSISLSIMNFPNKYNIENFHVNFSLEKLFRDVFHL